MAPKDKEKKKPSATEGAASSSADTAAPAEAGTETADVTASGRKKQPVEKQPPSLKMTAAVLFVLFLFMHPGVRWRVSEFNTWFRSSIPCGGNPLLCEAAPRGLAADMVTIESRFGANSELMTGRYLLRKEKVNGRYSWFKNSPGQEAYLLWDDCGAWLISRFKDGNSPNCEGWSYTTKCFGLPWECPKEWMIREDSRWEEAGDTIKVKPFFGEVPNLVAPTCSAEQEQNLIEKFGDFDIVIPWINGTDPQWLADRARTCEDWQWQEMWLDAITRSFGTRNCLKDSESVKEATALIARGGCEQGIETQEGACLWGKGNTAPIGLTTRKSRCFRKFVDSHCTGRVNSIKDHDELRYLIRSVERHLSWHRGRILLITPNKVAPPWLKSGGRLEVIAQEDLLQNAVSSNHFVSAVDRGRDSDWAPGRIFNDYPVQAALAFVPKATRVMMLLQDDILFARPQSICQFFTPDPFGLRLFARPFESVSNRDPFSQIYESMEAWTSALFHQVSKKKDGFISPYYRDLHLPHMLDTHLLEELWRNYPEVMSDAASSALRHPNLTNVISLHHSEAARRFPEVLVEEEGDKKTSKVDALAKKIIQYLGLEKEEEKLMRESVEAAHDVVLERSESDLDLRITNLVMNISGPNPIHEFPWMEVVFESITDWNEKMAKLPPEPAKLPGIIGMQDNFGGDMQEDVAKLDCLREKWLNKLLPGPSSFEDPSSPPDMCRSWRRPGGSSRSKSSGNGAPTASKKGRNDEL